MILCSSTRIEACLFSDAAKFVATVLEVDMFPLDTFASATTPPAALKKSRLCIIILSFILTGLMPGNYSRLDSKRNRKFGVIDVLTNEIGSAGILQGKFVANLKKQIQF